MEASINFYNEAIDTASIIGNRYLQALAHERLSEIFLKLKTGVSAKTHLEVSRRLYDEWGAQGKVTDLEKRYPFMLRSVSTEKYWILPQLKTHGPT